MKFSIIVPIYNTEKYIGACIESVLAQTYSDYELILVNDGSTDESGDICEKYSGSDNRIQVFHKENSGQIETRWYGVQKSKGDVVIFLDSDDLLSTNALSVIFEKIQKHHCDMLIYSAERFAEVPKVACLVSSQEDRVISTREDLYKTILFSENYNSLCLKAIKREFVCSNDSIKYKDVRYGEDLLQTLDIISRVPKTVIIPDVLYFYRTNMQSLTQSLRIEQYARDIVFVRKFVYDIITHEQILNPKELRDYRGVAIRLMAEGVANISRCKISQSQKNKLFNDIKRSEYFKTFLDDSDYEASCLGNKRIVWFLFQKNLYFVIGWLFAFKRLVTSR